MPTSSLPTSNNPYPPHTPALEPSVPRRLHAPRGVNLLRSALLGQFTYKELQAVSLVEHTRPIALRTYDQIPMQAVDLLRQVKLMLPSIAGKAVAFMGDYDSTSLLVGLLAKQKRIPSPRMLLLDFDERVLASALRFAKIHGFEDTLSVQLYNAFDPLPSHLVGRFDWFYTNPPYGSRNDGGSARLFITRGCELVSQQENADGCIILPDDDRRPWTSSGMLATQQYLSSHGWRINTKINDLHQYHLDDDRELASSVILVHRTALAASATEPMPFAARRVSFDEIPSFYGRSVHPPYPRYIDRSGNPICSWDYSN